MAGTKRARPGGTPNMRAGRARRIQAPRTFHRPRLAASLPLIHGYVFGFQALLQSEAFPVTGDDVRLVGQAIQQRCGQGGFAEDLGPVGKAQV